MKNYEYRYVKIQGKAVYVCGLSHKLGHEMRIKRINPDRTNLNRIKQPSSTGGAGHCSPNWGIAHRAFGPDHCLSSVLPDLRSCTH